MKTILLILCIATAGFSQTRLDLKDDFVNSCYATAMQDNTALDEGRVADYCKCVFDITAHQMSTQDLIKADNMQSKENKIFMDKMATSVDKCLYNIYLEN